MAPRLPHHNFFIITHLYCWLLLLMSIITVARPGGQYEEICQWESFNGTCGPGEVIMMESARYGRMSMGPCLTRKYGEEGCVADVIDYVDTVCSGRSHCKLDVPDIAMQGIRPCSEQLASFLQVSYHCVKVVQARPEECRYNKQYIVTSPSGYLASEAVPSDLYGSSCPYHIKVQPGQKINLTLYDFSARTNRMAGQPDVCRRYALVKDGQGVRETPICGSDTRVRSVYLSDSNFISVTLVNGLQPSDKSYFMLKYEAVGCGRLVPPANAHVDKQGDSWVVACNFTDQKWYLHCDHSTWVGKAGNCTEATKPNLWNVLTDDWSSPYGILVVVGLGVALGVVIGILLLAVVLLWLRRKKWLKRNPGESSKAPSGADSRNYQSTLTYNTESTYAPCDSWLSNRPLPVPHADDPGSKRGLDPAVIQELQGKYPHHHIYESSSFPRRDLSMDM